VRRAELREACGILGIERLELGGHDDGRLGDADDQQVIGEIVRLLRQERPDVVLTFGPEGAPTEHRDHKAISEFARRAVECAASDTEFPEQLMGTVRPHRVRRICFVTWPAPKPGDLYQAVGQPAHIRIDAHHWNGRKLEAYLSHRSQRQHQENFERYAMVEAEWYSVAGGTPAPNGAEDLFAGL
jgi:LmbE family N-acetylglucosaminyl deacetylase